MTLPAPSLNDVVLHVPQRQGWLVFRRPLALICATELRDVISALAEIERQVQDNGRYAAGFLAYEAAPAFDPACQVNTPAAGGFPLLWFGIYEQPEFHSTSALRVQGEFPRLDWQPQGTQDEYRRAIRRIKRHIARGDTYQVNFTYRLRAEWGAARGATAMSAGQPNRPIDPSPDGNPLTFSAFSSLAAAQRPPYAAFIETQDWAVCSFSPELFFTLDGEILSGRPMKGTIQRGGSAQEDLRLRDWLYQSEKNRAENVMIVDMVRNDMGRIARSGSVHVPQLFSIEKYPTVWQMTSTVQAQTGAGLVEILQALYPCASITGAPKISTMRIIRALESSPRQVYTGAIGYYGPGRQAQFNVPIRTLLLDKRQGQAEYSVGGGIVWDSKPQEEWQETHTKARILYEPPQPFELLETLRWMPGDGYFLLDGHLQRLQRSAEYFAFGFDREKVLRALEAEAQGMAAELAAHSPQNAVPGSAAGDAPGGAHAAAPSPPAFRLRLLLDRDGELRLEHFPLDLAATPRRVGLALDPVHSDDRFLYHKTTSRQVYQDALARRPDCQDVLLWNERGELTESAIANLALEIDGVRYTPPVASGLLPGVYRQWMLDQGMVKERVLRKDDLARAEAIYLFNSLRGMWQVQLAAGEISR